jgi:hypothetical protein
MTNTAHQEAPRQIPIDQVLTKRRIYAPIYTLNCLSVTSVGDGRSILQTNISSLPIYNYTANFVSQNLIPGPAIIQWIEASYIFKGCSLTRLCMMKNVESRTSCGDSSLLFTRAILICLSLKIYSQLSHLVRSYTPEAMSQVHAVTICSSNNELAAWKLRSNN